ncbi:MAG TPA: cyclic nucleotide-binding domain-containing protein [Ktedonobacterales bacterium]|jgi:CRP/FNR family transcriptional regulator
MFWRKRNQPSGNQSSGAGAAPSQQGATDEHIAMLGRVPLFVDLSKRELQHLSVACRERQYATGEVLLRQGEPGAGLFVVVSGQVQITQHHDDATSQAITTAGPGEVFGEMALLDDQPRSATVTALEPTKVLLLPVFDFRAVLREDGDISVRLLAVISRRLRRAEARAHA